MLVSRGVKPPSWYSEEPHLPPGCGFHLRAFADLSTERQIGTVTGPIPTSQIRAYAARYGLEERAAEQLEEIVRAADRAYLKWLSDEQAKIGRRDRGAGRDV